MNMNAVFFIKSKKTSLLIIFGLAICFFNRPIIYAQELSGFNNPNYYQQPIIKWGNSSYHDSLGIREPFIYKEGENFYLYYDCIEQLYNPSFENNLGVNGWSAYRSNISTTSEKYLFGNQSLKVISNGQLNAGVYTGKYYYQNNISADFIASPDGLEVMPGFSYIASAYVWAESGRPIELWVQQYKDDPEQSFYTQNIISAATVKNRVNGNGSWQRISVRFTADVYAKAATLSLVIPETLVTTTYLDGVQLERIATTQTTPSDFPSGTNFNQKIEDILGWRTCLAKSTDGINFQKKGMVTVLGEKGQWENLERSGRVGSSFTYASIFKNGSKYYTYTWEGGYALGSTYTLDAGIVGSRSPFYQDRRAQIPNGDPPKSGLAFANSPEGPFYRMSQDNPVIAPPIGEASCEASVRDCGSLWGCDYLTSIGTPVFIDGQWIIYTGGQTLLHKGVWEGTFGGNSTGCHAISAGYASSTSALGPWNQWSGNPIFDPSNLVNIGTALEGPIYYRDISGYHVLFLNAISGGAHAIEAFWTLEPLSRWPILANRKTIIDWYQIPWTGGAKGNINLATVAESTDKNTLFLYYAARNNIESTVENYRSYLFHDIGLITYPLPLLKGNILATPTPNTVSCQICASGPAKNLGNANCDGKVNAIDFALWKRIYTAGGLIPETEKANVDFNCNSITDTTHIINLFDFKIWAGNYR